jgi:hypothetical protein
VTCDVRHAEFYRADATRESAQSDFSHSLQELWNRGFAICLQSAAMPVSSSSSQMQAFQPDFS